MKFTTSSHVKSAGKKDLKKSSTDLAYDYFFILSRAPYPIALPSNKTKLCQSISVELAY